MKKFLFLVLALVLIFTVSCSKNATPTASDNGNGMVTALTLTWSQMTHAQRTEAIITRANQDNGYVFPNLECKTWVQTVVTSASGGAAVIPQNQNNYTWYTNSSVAWPSQYSCIPVENAQRGWMIQMSFRNTSDHSIINPHTIIIENVYSTYMDIIDCNLDPPSGHKVSHRTMTYQYFYDHAYDANGNSHVYNLYYVI